MRILYEIKDEAEFGLKALQLAEEEAIYNAAFKRKPLSKFKRYLDLISTKCSICGKELNGDISIDHVIPWSYMYSDDLNYNFTNDDILSIDQPSMYLRWKGTFFQNDTYLDEI